MAYAIPALYVIVSYTFFLLPRLFGDVIELKFFLFFLPFIMGLANLIVVLTVGRKWSRRTLLNCALIIKYGLIPFYLIGGGLAVGAMVLAIFPLPFMVVFGLMAAAFLIFGYGILLGAAPYSIAYLVKACKEGTHFKAAAILVGICQFFFAFDVLAMMVMTLKERHLVKTTIAVFVAALLGILLIVCAVGIPLMTA